MWCEGPKGSWAEFPRCKWESVRVTLNLLGKTALVVYHCAIQPQQRLASTITFKFWNSCVKTNISSPSRLCLSFASSRVLVCLFRFHPRNLSPSFVHCDFWPFPSMCMCLLCYLSVWLSNTLGSSLSQATPCAAFLSCFVAWNISDVLLVMDNHSPKYFPVEFSHIFHDTFFPKKIIAMETTCAGKSLT